MALLFIFLVNLVNANYYHLDINYAFNSTPKIQNTTYFCDFKLLTIWKLMIFFHTLTKFPYHNIIHVAI